MADLLVEIREVQPSVKYLVDGRNHEVKLAHNTPTKGTHSHERICLYFVYVKG